MFSYIFTMARSEQLHAKAGYGFLMARKYHRAQGRNLVLQDNDQLILM